MRPERFEKTNQSSLFCWFFARFHLKFYHVHFCLRKDLQESVQAWIANNNQANFLAPRAMCDKNKIFIGQHMQGNFTKQRFCPSTNIESMLWAKSKDKVATQWHPHQIPYPLCITIYVLKKILPGNLEEICKCRWQKRIQVHRSVDSWMLLPIGKNTRSLRPRVGAHGCSG